MKKYRIQFRHPASTYINRKWWYIEGGSVSTALFCFDVLFGILAPDSPLNYLSEIREIKL